MMEELKMKTQNRKEIFLRALANGEEANIKPLTREEMLLKKQAERESASGGGAFVVNLDGSMFDGYTADKTCDDILSAYNNGQMIQFNIKGKVITSFEYANGAFCFETFMMMSETQLVWLYFKLDANGVTVKYKKQISMSDLEV